VSIFILALISSLLLVSPPQEDPSRVTDASHEDQPGTEGVAPLSQETGSQPATEGPSPEPEPAAEQAAPEQDPAPASAQEDPAPEQDPAASEPEPTPEPDEEISPLVPHSQIEFLRGHPVKLDKIEFKPGKGLSFVSESNRFALTMTARVMLLYNLDHDDTPEADPELEHLFQVRRARMVFAGHMFNEHNKFKIELSLSPRDVSLRASGPAFTIMRDYYLKFDYLRDLTLVVGQYKIPYSQQRVISSGRLQIIDRSITGPEFDLDREIGLDLRSKDFLGLERLRYYAGVYVGSGRDNSAPEPVLRGGGLVYLARIEVLPFKQFDDYVEGDFTRTTRPRLSLGAAYAYMDEATYNRGTKGARMSDGGTTNYHNATASMMFKIVGVSLFGEFFWRKGVRDPGDAEIEDDMGNLVPAPVEPPRNGYGWYTQFGVMIPHLPLEIVGRYSQIRAIGDETESSTPNNNELGGGLNWYFAGHPYKLSADYFRHWDAVIHRGLDQVRVQFQLSF
jgi:phosphate-selective porin OprO and OprP